MAPTRGAIAGDVTEDGTGDPVADVWAVTVSGADNAPETGTTANAAGHYRIDGLRPGDHYVAIVDPAGAHRPEFYPDAPDITTADTVAVTAGTTATADLALTAQTPDPGGATLEGTIVETGTADPLDGVYAIALRAADFRYTRAATSDPSGHYRLDVAPGDYKLEFVDPTGLHDMEWNDDHPYYDIAIADSATAPGVADADLDPRTGTLAGTIVDDTTGDPVEGAWVVAIASSGIAGGAVTAADGTYTVPGLPAGAYVVTIADPNGGHLQEYFEDSPDYPGATPVDVVAGATATIDAALALP